MTGLKVQRLVYPLGTRRSRYKRCEAMVVEATARWRQHIGRDNQCELGALYICDGKHLCHRHMGKYLIDQLLVEPGVTVGV